MSQRPDGRGIRVGWLSPGQLIDPTDVAQYPEKVPATTIDDEGTTIIAAKRGALAVTYTRADGLTVHALTAHFKSKLLTFPGRRPDQPRFDTNDEGERARFGLYALAQRAAEAATARAWATTQLQNAGQNRHVLICGDLNDTPQAARPVRAHHVHTTRSLRPTHPSCCESLMHVRGVRRRVGRSGYVATTRRPWRLA